MSEKTNGVEAHDGGQKRVEAQETDLVRTGGDLEMLNKMKTRSGSKNSKDKCSLGSRTAANFLGCFGMVCHS